MVEVRPLKLLHFCIFLALNFEPLYPSFAVFSLTYPFMKMNPPLSMSPAWWFIRDTPIKMLIWIYMSSPWLKPDPKPSSTHKEMRGKLAGDTCSIDV